MTVSPELRLSAVQVWVLSAEALDQTDFPNAVDLEGAVSSGERSSITMELSWLWMIKTGVLNQHLCCALHTHLNLYEGSKSAILTLFEWCCVAAVYWAFKRKQ